MPLPLIIGIGAAIAGAAGVGAGVHGAVKTKDANDRITLAKSRHEKNIERFEKQHKDTSIHIDELRKKELEILQSFNQFSDLFERIKNRPVFKSYQKGDVNIPQYSKDEIRRGAFDAGIFLVTFNSSMVGSMAGSVGSGGIPLALGLGAATLGVGLLVGGVISSFTGSKLSDKADEAWAQMKEAEKRIDKICDYLIELSQVANDYRECISKVDREYQSHLNKLYDIIVVKQKNDWNYFTNDEKMITENTALLVNLLYNMGTVKLVLVSENEELNKINKYEINESMKNAETFLKDRLA